MINHASNVLICKKRNDAISGVVQSWAVKASVTKSETLKGNEILYFLTVMLVKPSLTLEEKWLIKKVMFCIFSTDICQIVSPTFNPYVTKLRNRIAI